MPNINTLPAVIDEDDCYIGKKQTIGSVFLNDAGLMKLKKADRKRIIELLTGPEGMALLAKAVEDAKRAEEVAARRASMVTQKIILPEGEILG